MIAPKNALPRLLHAKESSRKAALDFNASTGLKIKYLTTAERRQRFEDLQLPLGNVIRDLKPPLELFAKKFGWFNLDIDPKIFSYAYGKSIEEDDCATGPLAKKPRRELDGFLTIEEACRHYFDAKTLDEAIYDMIGIPRLLILNGDVMRDASVWTYCSLNEAVLGDKTVQLGSRFAHAVDSSGFYTLYKEDNTDRRRTGWLRFIYDQVVSMFP